MTDHTKSSATASSGEVTGTKPKPHRVGAGVTASAAPGKRSVRLDSNPEGNVFKPMGGSGCHAFNATLLREVLGCIHVQTSEGEDSGEATSRTVGMAMAALKAFKPTDEIEGMIAAQATALHFSAMECFRRANLNEGEISSRLRKDGANMARGMSDMLEALDRKRGKGPQVIRVERMVVQDGGQAVVGNVQAGALAPPAQPAPQLAASAADGVALDMRTDLVPAKQRGRAGA